MLLFKRSLYRGARKGDAAAKPLPARAVSKTAKNAAGRCGGAAGTRGWASAGGKFSLPRHGLLTSASLFV